MWDHVLTIPLTVGLAESSAITNSTVANVMVLAALCGPGSAYGGRSAGAGGTEAPWTVWVADAESLSTAGLSVFLFL